MEKHEKSLLQQKQENLNYIMKFQEIKLTTICKKLNINIQNLYHGRVSADKVLQVKLEIQKQLVDLVLTEKQEG